MKERARRRRHLVARLTGHARRLVAWRCAGEVRRRWPPCDEPCKRRLPWTRGRGRVGTRALPWWRRERRLPYIFHIHKRIAFALQPCGALGRRPRRIGRRARGVYRRAGAGCRRHRRGACTRRRGHLGKFTVLRQLLLPSLLPRKRRHVAARARSVHTCRPQGRALLTFCTPPHRRALLPSCIWPQRRAHALRTQPPRIHATRRVEGHAFRGRGVYCT